MNECCPEVKITKLTFNQAQSMSMGTIKSTLGDTKLDSMLQIMINKRIHSSSEILLLEWEGNKIPRGAKIGNKEIAWTQHGIVTDKNGDDIGTYERIVEFGGVSKYQQVMLVYPR